MSHALFAEELVRAREAAGMTQKELADAINYSPSTVAMVETCRRLPKQDLAERCDEVLKTGGLLGRIRRHSLRVEALPEWFRAWSGIEQQATTIRTYQPTIVPGLLQTEGYARALLRDDERVMARMDRQAILRQEDAPTVVAIIDESVLGRVIGSPEVMHDQLQRLADPAAVVRVHVLPADAETHMGVDGSFVLATLDGRTIGYADTPLHGVTREDPEVVSGARERWEALMIEALPHRQSRDLILKVAEQWKSKTGESPPAREPTAGTV
jgi:transcriptional regulator with XRE-family HTH domain